VFDRWQVDTRKQTPAEIVDELYREINAVLADPKMKVRLGDLARPCR
jgi:hypothetical protein